MASSVEKRMARALPVFRIERLAAVIPTFSASSPEVILRLASITSTFTMIDIVCLFIRFYIVGNASHGQAVLLAQANACRIDDGNADEEKRDKECARINHKEWCSIDNREVIGTQT